MKPPTCLCISSHLYPKDHTEGNVNVKLQKMLKPSDLHLCWSRRCHESSYLNIWKANPHWESNMSRSTIQSLNVVDQSADTAFPKFKNMQTVARLFSMQSAAHLRFLPIPSLLQNDDRYLISQHKTTLRCVIKIKKKIQLKNLCKLISPLSKKKLWAFFFRTMSRQTRLLFGCDSPFDCE